MKQRTLPIVLASLLLGLVFDLLFYGKVPGISVFIYTSLILGFTIYLAQWFRNPINKSIYWLAPVILFFSFMVFVRANPFLAVINIFLVLYLLIMVAQLAHQPTFKLGQYDILQYFGLTGRVPFRILSESLEFLLKSVSNRNAKVPKSSLGPILRGIILSVPILFVFLLLLSSADLVFKSLIESMFDLSIAPETVFRWGLIGFVASLFMGAFAFIFMPSSKSEANLAPTKRWFDLGTTEASIILGSVSLLFFVFVIIQLAYLFGGSGQITSTGHTYAEYARKGFFELTTVATISLLLILTIKKITMFRTLGQSLIFKCLSGILVAEVMVIMLSAHLRLNLYEDAYGFTTLRLFSHLFIAWLAIAFILLLIHIIRDKSEKRLAFQLFISALCFLGVMNLLNPDAFIAKQNINRFNKVGKIDLYYLSNLSEDAIPAVADLLDHPNKKVQMYAANILYHQQLSRENQLHDWQSTNLARKRAIQIFRDNAVQIEAGKLHGDYSELDAK